VGGEGLVGVLVQRELVLVQVRVDVEDDLADGPGERERGLVGVAPSTGRPLSMPE
jgi:hypothetical protein